MSELNVALVTGGASGIGWATVQELVRSGWHVVVGDLDYVRAQERARSHADRMLAVDLDVRDGASVDRAVDATLNAFGRLDALVNNAGIQKWSALETLDWKAWSDVIDVNLNGATRCLQAAGRHMLGNGRGAIVNVVSIAAQRGVPQRAAYAAAKAGLLGLTRTAAVEWAARGVRVNAIGPGYVATELIERYITAGQLDPQAITANIPMGRMARPAEIARVIRFLLSDDASYITGQELYVDGGFLAHFGLTPPQ